MKKLGKIHQACTGNPKFPRAVHIKWLSLGLKSSARIKNWLNTNLYGFNGVFAAVTFLAFAAAAYYACIAKKTLEQIGYQVQAATEESRLAHPARFRVVNVAIGPELYHEFDGNFKPRMRLVGEAAVINFGHTASTVTGAMCGVYWHEGPLPTLRPYFYDKSAFKDCTPAVNEPADVQVGGNVIFKPGNVGFWKFETSVPQNYKSAMKLYFMGYITNHDDSKADHFMLFARMWDPKQHRFVPVDNPDYEGQDTP